MENCGDLCDWEVLHNSDASDSGADYSVDSNSHAIFQSDYFSLDSHRKEASSDDGSAVSDNPSWIDPASDAPFPPTNSADLWSESGSDMNDKSECSELELGAQVEVKMLSDSCGEETPGGGDDGNRLIPGENKEEKPRVFWWKIPLDLLKHCVFRVSPVWSLSVAAALVGFVILGRRLYKLKRKTNGLHLKVITDDKRVSQFMIHASRLNEAFSLVRRVPIVRPSLPGPGAAAWPVMSMR